MPQTLPPKTFRPTMPDVLNLFELEKLAKEKLPQTAYDYYASGAWDEITIRGTRTAFERLQVHYRVLVDVSRRDLSTTLFEEWSARRMVRFGFSSTSTRIARSLAISWPVSSRPAVAR